MKRLKETFCYKGSPFVARPVRTDSYVWHLTSPLNRLNIAFEGILPVYGLLFANNENERIGAMWHWDTEYDCNDGSHLDYWRIDVRKAGVRWYCEAEFDLPNSQKCTFVCTPSPIPVEAITLFRHDESLKFIPSKYNEYGVERDWTSHGYAVKDLKDDFEKLYVKRTEGVASCSLRQLPLKRVDPILLLTKNSAKDRSNGQLAFYELPKLFEEQTEQTLAAIQMKCFGSFYETLFKNRMPIHRKEDWEQLFNALLVNKPGLHKGVHTGRFHMISIISELNTSYTDFDILITLPFNDVKEYRFFKMDWSKHLNSYSMEEYVSGAYHKRTNLQFSNRYYCSDALNRFLFENKRTR
jgi:hypothetical protein